MDHMQPNLSPSPTDRVCEHFGITGHKTMREFEVIAQAKSRGYQGQGEYDKVLEGAIMFLTEVMNRENNESRNNQSCS